MQLVAVTGATGYLGGFVLADLAARGCAVRAWTRAGPVEPRPGVQWLRGDLEDRGSVRDLVEGADALVHLAYWHAPGRYRGGEGRDLGRYLEVNLWGSLRLLEMAYAAGVGRCVVLSSRAVYPAGVVGCRLHESRATRPDSHYGAYKAALEAFVASYAQQHGWHIAALRPTGIYGLVAPAERSKWYALVRDALEGCEIDSVRGGTEVHGADVARAIWLLLNDPRAQGTALNCSDLYVTTRDVARLTHRLVGRGGPLPAVPETAPASLMATSRLEALGWQPGGHPLLEQTIGQIVTAIRGARSGRP